MSGEWRPPLFGKRRLRRAYRSRLREQAALALATQDASDIGACWLTLGCIRSMRGLYS